MRKLTIEELQNMINRREDFALIDVLPEQEFESTRIPGAQNVPFEEPDFAARVRQIAQRNNRKVVLYCANEQCGASMDAAQKLEAAGFTNVAVFKGGARAWQESEAKTHAMA